MALTAARVTHAGALLGFAVPWVPDGAAPPRALVVTPDGLPELAGVLLSPYSSGHLWPLGQTPAQPWLAQVASSAKAWRFPTHPAASWPPAERE